MFATARMEHACPGNKKSPQKAKCLPEDSEGGRVTSGIRTHDIQNHNLTL